ncbi:MAG TPA: hypothetical protein VFD69_02700 [Vicinamibacterales bacterium]|nr:hypothetical protein [Vicinamibacterales bacterium]
MRTPRRSMIIRTARWTLPAGLVLAAASFFVPEAVGRNAAIILDTVTVRVYDSAGVTPRDRAAALKTAGAILSRANLDATWIVCTPARDGKQQPGCDAAPASHELVVRLTYSSPTAEDGNSRAFGYSLIDATTSTGTLSTVFVDRVDWLASTGKAVRADVLGRAIAHEIGHQILGSNDHSARGLMRETWTAEELTRNRPEDWQFSSAQRTALHARWAGWGLGRRAGTRDPRSAFGS